MIKSYISKIIIYLLSIALVISLVVLNKEKLILPANKYENINTSINKDVHQLVSANIQTQNKTNEEPIKIENNNNTEITTSKKENTSNNTKKTDKQTTSNKTSNQSNKTSTTKKESNKKTYTVTKISETKYTKCSLNVRSGPDTSYKKLGTLSEGEKVSITGEVNDKWLQISYKGKIGYISGSFLTSSKPEPFTTVLINDGHVSTEKMKKVDKSWKSIPSNVRNKLLASGWKFYVTSYKIQGRYYTGNVSGSIAGVTSYSKKTIYVSHRDSPVKRQVIIHEVGHAWDYYKGLLSESKEFKAIFKEEKYKFNDLDAIGDGHHISNSTEYFAEAFSNYIKAPNSLKKSAPKTYNFIKNHI